MIDGLERLRAILAEAPAASLPHDEGRPLELGRPLLAGLATAGPDVPRERFAAGVAWGWHEPSELEPWLDRIERGGVVAQVVPVARGGARGTVDRVLLLASGHTPVELDEVCTALFLRGVAELRVIELEARRHIFAVTGRKRS